MARREQSALTYSAFDVLQNYLREIQEGNEGEARESLARAAVQEFADYICPIVARGEGSLRFIRRLFGSRRPSTASFCGRPESRRFSAAKRFSAE
jgi:hypothetical protein